ncbi:unnamed protein product [Rotaria sp. Silwood1]|nr:unnamed protein product [Rotaria sp. Silwood1]CAF1142728.1 unnamed protein product [Rotaria sp. Silwood1]CAF3428911.1 unnamed protein product [Rotaria sp. Silwood1]CAF3474803.1 unnamed protein product [Rotaria sp. Silwood1]CAF3486150.1 unnamed protein product [Rotaria sp. Silwood1]
MNVEINSDNYLDDDVELTSETDQGGIVIPKQTCEHVQYVELLEKLNHINKIQCIDCESTNENWLCLSCEEIHCSRYINNHGEEHWLFTLLTDGHYNIGHCLTISLQDLSVWCYPCKSYVKNIRLNPLIKHLESIKFGLLSTNENENQLHSNTINKLVIKENIQNPSTIIAIQDPLLSDELEKTDLLSYCYTIKIRSASIDELVCLHSSDYVNMIVSAEKNHKNTSNNQFHIEYNETAFSNARLSAGITIDVIQNVLDKHINGFILTTSPGHRALRDHGNGTSIYNNIALGINSILMKKIKPNKRKNSLTLIDSRIRSDIQDATPIENAICHMIHVLTPASIIDYPMNSNMSTVTDNNNNNKIQIEHVLIIDLTCEHGGGIQSIYYESDQVFYISIHNENHEHKSSYHECGKNDGLGYTMNIPLASIDTINDTDYICIINELVLPITKIFKPELIIVCVDFHIQQLTELCYAWIIEQLSMISSSNLVVALDGNLSCISSRTSYIQTILSVLIGKLSLINNDKWKNNTDVNSDVRKKIDLVKQEHKKYWSCFE